MAAVRIEFSKRKGHQYIGMQPPLGQLGNKTKQAVLLAISEDLQWDPLSDIGVNRGNNDKPYTYFRFGMPYLEETGTFPHDIGSNIAKVLMEHDHSVTMGEPAMTEATAASRRLF